MISLIFLKEMISFIWSHVISFLRVLLVYDIRHAEIRWDNTLYIINYLILIYFIIYVPLSTPRVYQNNRQTFFELKFLLK